MSIADSMTNEGLLTADLKQTTMEIGIKHAFLLLAIAPAFISLSHAGCSGSCAISGSGTSSYDFLGEPSIDPTLDTFTDFVRDKLNQTSLSTQSVLMGAPMTDSSFNQTNIGNASLNSSATYNMTNNLGRGATNNAAVKLGASGIQDVSKSTLASTIFDNNML